MNWAQTVNTLVFVFGTLFGVYAAIHLANIQKQKLSDHMATRLEQFSHMAVCQVEQQNEDMGGPSKKQLARNIVLKLFKGFNLPSPSEEAINTAIESAVFSLPPKS